MTTQELRNIFIRHSQKKFDGLGTYLHNFAPMEKKVEPLIKSRTFINSNCEVEKYISKSGKEYVFEKPIPLAEFKGKNYE